MVRGNNKVVVWGRLGMAAFLCAAVTAQMLCIRAQAPDIAMPVSTASKSTLGPSTTPVSLDDVPTDGAGAVYRQMAEYLAAQKSFFVDISSTTTITGAGNYKPTGGISRVWYRRPNHIVWTTQSDIGASAMAIDGSNCTLYLPVLSRYMVTPVKNNPDVHLAAMSAPYGMVATSLFASDVRGALQGVLTGPPRLEKTEEVLGVQCRHLKLPTRAGEVDLWVAQGPIPLPVKISSSMSIPASPGEDNAIDSKTEVSFRWRVNVELPDSTFQLKLPDTAARTDRLGSPIKVASADASKKSSGAGSKSRSVGKPSKSESVPKKPRDSSGRTFDLAFDPPPSLNGGLPSAFDSSSGENIPSLRGNDVVQQAIRGSKPDAVPSGASYQPSQEQSAPPPPSSAAQSPSIQLSLLNGQTINLSNYRGKKAIVLDFWATWCGPCRQSMPVVNQLADVYRNRGVEFFAVNMAEDASQIQSFLQQQGISIPVAVDPYGQLAAAFGVSGIPHLVVIGRDGTVKGTHTGADSSLAHNLTRDLEIAIR